MKLLLKTEELGTLAKLLGEKLDYVAGNYLTSGLNSDVVYVRAGSQTISVTGDVAELDFGGFEEDFAYLKVAEIKDMDSIAAHHEVGKSFQQSGEVITAIEIGCLRSVNHLHSGNDVSVTTDRTIILHLTGGSLTIALRSLHLEMIEMVFADVTTEPQIRPLSTHYTDESADRFEFTESVVALDEALSRCP